LIDYIKSKGVTFVDYAKYLDTQSCNSEWNFFGSCCNTVKLTTMVNKQTLLVSDIMKKATIRVSRLQSYTNHLLIAIKVSLQTISTKITNSGTITTEQKTELLDELGRISGKYVPKLEETNKSITENQAANLKSQDHCVQYINSLRSASVCYACSGRAPIFFTEGKLNMHENECRNSISKCSDAWLNLLMYINALATFQRHVVELSNLLNINFGKYMASDYYSDIGNLSTQTYLLSQLSGCRDGLCDFESSQKICDAMISYQQPYYLEKILGIIGNKTEEVVNTNSEDQLAFRESVINMFEKESFDQLVARILAIRKERLWHEGQVTAGDVRPDSIELIPIIADTPQDPLLLDSKLMPCQTTEVCDADKVVMTTSQCTLSTLLCTSPLYTFP